MFFSIKLPVPVLFGDRVSLQAGRKIQELGATKVLTVYDRGLKSTGIIDPILHNIRALGIDIVEFDGVVPDPPDTVINEGGALGRQEQVDCILGIGGGSSLDTAKAINVLMGNDPPFKNYFGYGSLSIKPGVKLVLIPTTSGTGSEVTTGCVITNSENNQKIGVLGPSCTADLAIVDPHLTVGLPPGITAYTGMDAFAHAVEAYTGIAASMMTDTLSEKAIEIIGEYLPRVVEDGTDLEARTKMSFASTIAGYSFSNGYVHLGHAISHTLGALFSIPHGIGCAIVMPCVLEFVAGINPGRVKRIGELMGLRLPEGLSSDKQLNAVIEGVRSLNKQIGIPTLKELGVDEAALPRVAQLAAKESSLIISVRKIVAGDVLPLIQKEFALQ